MGAAYDKAWILYRQSRYEMALRQVEEELAASPNDSASHGLMALCLTGTGQFLEALRAAARGIELNPSLPFPHYAFAWVLYKDTKYESYAGSCSLAESVHGRDRRLFRAEQALAEALRLAPREASYFGLLAYVLNDGNKHEPALKAARDGLEIDPFEANCLRIQAIALGNLGRADEALKASAAAVACYPEGAIEHSIHARALLRCKRYGEAADHFAESLRLDPRSQTVRAELLEAIKSLDWMHRLLTRLRIAKDGKTVPAARGKRTLYAIAAYAGGLVLHSTLTSHGVPNKVSMLLSSIVVIPLWFVLSGRWLVILRTRRNPAARNLITRRQTIGACVGLVLVAGLCIWLIVGSWFILRGTAANPDPLGEQAIGINSVLFIGALIYGLQIWKKNN